MVNDMVKRAEEEREKIFLRTHELMPSGQVAESESRIARKTFPPSQVQKTEFRSSWV